MSDRQHGRDWGRKNAVGRTLVNALVKAVDRRSILTPVWERLVLAFSGRGLGNGLSHALHRSPCLSIPGARP